MANRRRRGYGEGSIYPLSDGRWRGSVELAWINGQRRRRTVTRKTRAEVTREVRRLALAAESGTLNSDRAPTVEIWMQSYLRDIAPQRVRPTTLRQYKDEVRLHINPTLGRIRLDQLRPQHIAELYRTKSATLSPSSVRHMHAVLRRSLTIAVRWGLIQTNPAQQVDPPPLANKEVQPWSAEEARDFLTAVRGERLAARWVVGLSLGLRQGETLGLEWQDIDLERGVLRVRQALKRLPDGTLALVDTKTVRSRRQVPMPEPVVESLTQHQGRQRAERELLGQSGAWDLVFTTAKGTPINPRNDYRTFQRIIERAELRRIRLHDLRHTAASLLLAQGVPARVVMEILGHSQISVTLNTYSHVAPELSRVAADRMKEALWPPNE